MTPQDQWTAVDQYLCDLLVVADPVLDECLCAGDAAGLPQINVTPNQGKFLQMLAMTCGARRILEIGTLAGYSSIWLARGLPAEGQLVTLEVNPSHADVARANFARAGISDRIDLRVGRALDTLPRLATESGAPFDLTFIDADKSNTMHYFDWAVRMSRVGSLIIVDNVVRKGAVLDSNSADVDIRGTRQFLRALAHDSRVTATALQTVGSKGYDGMAVARVTLPS
jgi:predicted O-methyltransferase YrrM